MDSFLLFPDTEQIYISLTNKAEAIESKLEHSK